MSNHVAIKWEKKAPHIYVAHVKKPRRAFDGRKFTAHEAVRITKEKGGYRIDFAGNVAGAWLPWEAIDEVSHRTVASAKKAVRAYVEKQPEEI